MLSLDFLHVIVRVRIFILNIALWEGTTDNTMSRQEYAVTDTYEFHHNNVSFAQGYNGFNIVASNISTIRHIKAERSIWPAFWAHLGVVLSVKYDCDPLAYLCMIPQYKMSVPRHEHRQSFVE